MKKPQLDTVHTWIANPEHAALPLHTRVHRAIRVMILDGALQRRGLLPSSRTLARSLNVSRDTIESAYRQLHAEGLIERRIGSGTVVSEAAFIPLVGAPNRRTAGQAPVIGNRGGKMFEPAGSTTAPARAFTPGAPDTRCFPVATWERLHRQVLRDSGIAALGQGDPQGEESLRRAIASYVNLERGGRATADRILVLTSSQQAIWLCATVLFDAGDKILVENPLYDGARRAFEAASLKLAPVNVDGDGIRVEDLPKTPQGAKGVYVVPSHQYPTGSTLSHRRRLDLIQWAYAQRSWIIEDDYDSDFYFGDRPLACVQGLDPHHQTVYIGTFTKSVFPALRIAYLVLPTRLVQPMVAARTLLDGFTATISQLTLTRFLEGGHFGAHVRTMRGIYAERLEALKAALDTKLSGLVTAWPPSCGLQMPCMLAEPGQERASVDKARSFGIELIPLSAFYLGDDPRYGWLMGFAAYTPQEIRLAVSQLASAFMPRKAR